MKKVKVLVACGSGIATSSYAEAAVKDIAKNAGVPIDISKSTIQESEAKSNAFDVILFTSSNWNNFIHEENIKCPALSVASLITGFEEDETKEQLTTLLKQLSSED
ncbi:PTS sugar transporter subunit IIB [Anaerofustis stercorihominis]|uniref:PTS sugar transporter subunit IIB n=1 Tax=Anaerofustis stercorihominis TaxID=214853 RepID=UPI00214B45ED|nr:PTS galactitol transporter subunit IIB [Anaerofustis stercorihominis]MCR2032024.1 PTS galactitol transporter subunit IIB [Anaerofustis stercorihominis]